MTKPTILFIHGAFVTPESFKKIENYFTDRGFNTITPPWPFHDNSKKNGRKNASKGLGNLGLNDLIEHYSKIIKSLPEKPIIIGHSFGGMLTQLLMDRNLGQLGIAISPAGTKGIFGAAYPTTAIATTRIFSFPWIKTIKLSLPEFKYAFVNGLPEKEQIDAYDKHVVPETTKIFFESAASAFKSNTPAAVNYNNGNRGPLLMIAAEKDRLVTAKQIKKNFSFYKQNSGAITEYKEFPNRNHWIIAQDGWEEVADYINNWIKVNN